MEKKFNITPQELPTTKNSELDTEYRKLLVSILFVSCWLRPEFELRDQSSGAICDVPDGQGVKGVEACAPLPRHH
eukprot:2908738-Rhodomonas_salina.1